MWLKCELEDREIKKGLTSGQPQVSENQKNGRGGWCWVGNSGVAGVEMDETMVDERVL